MPENREIREKAADELPTALYPMPPCPAKFNKASFLVFLTYCNSVIA
jgi:hypothetical protein